MGVEVGCGGCGGRGRECPPALSGREVMGWAEPGEEGRVWGWRGCVGK